MQKSDFPFVNEVGSENIEGQDDHKDENLQRK